MLNNIMPCTLLMSWNLGDTQMEDLMATSQSLEVQQKKELVSKDEKTVPARYYIPTTDIFETEDALTVVMEIPGVEKDAVEVNVESDICASRLGSTSRNTRVWTPYTPSIMSAILRGRSP